MVNTPVSNTSNFQRIVAPPETTRESGIQWYEVQQIAENNGVQIVGVTAESKEITRALFQIISENELSFVISQNASRISGKLEIDLEKLTRTIYLDVDTQRVTISGESNNPERIKVDGRIGLNTEKQTLLNQWTRIHKPLLDLSERTDPKDPTAKKSCWSCGFLGAAVVLSVACCAGANVACCASAASSASIYIDECKGACA